MSLPCGNHRECRAVGNVQEWVIQDWITHLPPPIFESTWISVPCAFACDLSFQELYGTIEVPFFNDFPTCIASRTIDRSVTLRTCVGQNQVEKVPIRRRYALARIAMQAERSDDPFNQAVLEARAGKML